MIKKMQITKIIILLLLTTTLLGKDYPIMLKIQSKVKIPTDFRDGVEEGLTIKGYSLVDEKAQQEALKNQSEQRNSECYDDSCLVDTGKMLAAKALIVVDVEKKEENSFKFKARFVDFEKGTTTKTKLLYYKSSLSNYEKLSIFGKELVGGLLINDTSATLSNPKKDETLSNPKDEIRDHSSNSKKEVKKEVKKVKVTKNKKTKNKKTKKQKKWGLNFSLFIGSSNGNIEIYREIDSKNIYSKEDISNGGGGFSLGINYRYNNLIKFFIDFDVFQQKNSTEEYYPILRTGKFNFGTQLTLKRYYAKVALGLGNSTTPKEETSDENASNWFSDESFPLLSLLIEGGVNVNMLWNHNFDIFISLSSIRYMGAKSNFEDGGGMQSLLGIRYNFFNF